MFKYYKVVVEMDTGDSLCVAIFTDKNDADRYAIEHAGFDFISSASVLTCDVDDNFVKVWCRNNDGICYWRFRQEI